MGKASRTKTSQKPINIGKERNWFPWIVTIATILLVAVIAIVVVLSNQSTQPGEQSSTAPQGVINDGYVLTANGLDTSAPAQEVETTFEASPYEAEGNNLSIFIDYACPHCADFESNNFEQVKTWLNDGTLDSLSIHPVAFLTPYSANAANALACVAQNDPANLLPAHETLMTNYDQGLNTRGIIDALKEANVNVDSEMESCIRGTTYGTFVEKATERASQGPVPNSNIDNVTGTPTVLLNGTRYPGDPANSATFNDYVMSNLTLKEAETVSE